MTTEQTLDTRERLGAVLLYSRSLDREVWLACDEQVAAEVGAERRAKENEIPVLLFEEIPLLRGKSPKMLQGLLDFAAAFPGSRVVQ